MVKIEIDDGEKRVIFLVEYYQQLYSLAEPLNTASLWTPKVASTTVHKVPDRLTPTIDFHSWRGVCKPPNPNPANSHFSPHCRSTSPRSFTDAIYVDHEYSSPDRPALVSDG
jgi:hypothetical protein